MRHLKINNYKRNTNINISVKKNMDHTTRSYKQGKNR